ncbi:UDP-galactopyranose mutase [[Mycoplasma] mobile]|nr:UDP-galactopyranose mutase [[Mycoplasma] mobile]
MDILIAGAGLSGAVLANKLAKENKKVLIIEKRNHIGGNVFDLKTKGVLVHKYGPHIFHTSNKQVYDYMNQFWKLNNFQNIVAAKIKDEIVPIPFNYRGLDVFFPEKSEEIKEKLNKKYGFDKRIKILDLIKENDLELQKVADFIYKNVFENYTVKMWGLNPKEIDKKVTERVPIISSYNDKYFNDLFEGLPEEGYTNSIKKMLDHPNITVVLETNIKDLIKFKISSEGKKAIFFKEKELKVPFVFTGAIDELFDNVDGILDYRSLDIKFTNINQTKFQSNAVINYPAHFDITRITEYKHMTLQNDVTNTIISREYPGKYDPNSERFNVPFYPLQTEEANKKYLKYFERTKAYSNLFLVGRLAKYKYINMDQAIEEALEIFPQILSYESK